MRLTIRLLHEVADAYNQPLLTVARCLRTPRALAIEVARLRARQATAWAHELIADKQPPPDGTRIVDSLTRGYYAELQAERDRQKAAAAEAAWDAAYQAQQART